jgi:hypothetical protein
MATRVLSRARTELSSAIKIHSYAVTDYSPAITYGTQGML